MQHSGIGAALVKNAFDLARNAGASLRLVCPFAKDYLARHPELKTENAAVKSVVAEKYSLACMT
jgi:uncharacterized protein